ncbi:hypothetical protein PG995_010480 [Apiospora arundinis]
MIPSQHMSAKACNGPCYFHLLALVC